MENGVGSEIFAEIAVEGGEGVGRREAALEQEAHRIALISEAGLQPDEHLAELSAENEDG